MIIVFSNFNITLTKNTISRITCTFSMYDILMQENLFIIQQTSHWFFVDPFSHIFCIKEEMRRSIDIIMNVGQMNQSSSFANFERKEWFLSIVWFQENKEQKMGKINQLKNKQSKVKNSSNWRIWTEENSIKTKMNQLFVWMIFSIQIS